jgi:histone H3/H4
MLIVKAKIKSVLEKFSKEGKRWNVSGDFAPALNTEVEKLIEKALRRAEANQRKTIMAKDL